MRIIARRTLLDFVASLFGHKDQQAVKNAIDSWFDDVRKANWTSSADVKNAYATASIIGADRIVFNIKGNSYRMVVAVDYGRSIVWISDHTSYDQIDVRTVNYGN